MAGEVHGSKMYLSSDSALAATFVQIGGTVSNTLTLNHTPVEITNISGGDFKVFMDEEGIKDGTITGEFVLNSEATYAALYTDFDAGTIVNYRLGTDAAGKDFAAIITNLTQTSAQGESVKVSISLQVTGSFTS
jgi:predicted secreted protein